MTSWNPNFPCAQGLEGGLNQQVDRPVTGRGPAGYAWSLSSSSKEDIDGMWTFSNGNVANALDLIDIYDTADLRPAPVFESVVDHPDDGSRGFILDPTGDRRHTVAWWNGSVMLNISSHATPTAFASAGLTPQDLLGTFGNLIPATYYATYYLNFTSTPLAAQEDTFLSEGLEGAVQVPHRSFIGFTPLSRNLRLFSNWRWGNNISSTTYPFSWRGLDLDLPSAATRVLSVSTRALAQKIVRGDLIREFGNWPVVLQAFIFPGATWSSSGRGTAFGKQFVLSTAPEEFTQTWFVNPFTGREWTRAELEDLEDPTSSGARLGWRIRSVQSGVRWRLFTGRPATADRDREYGAIESVGGAIYAIEARARAVEDTRVAFAYRADNRTQKTGWNRWVVEKVGGGYWEKEAGREYLFHQTVDEAAFGGGSVARGLNIRALSNRFGGGQAPVRERVPQFLGPVPVFAGEIRPWSPAAVLEIGS